MIFLFISINNYQLYFFLQILVTFNVTSICPKSQLHYPNRSKYQMKILLQLVIKEYNNHLKCLPKAATSLTTSSTQQRQAATILTCPLNVRPAIWGCSLNSSLPVNIPAGRLDMRRVRENTQGVEIIICTVNPVEDHHPRKNIRI